MITSRISVILLLLLILKFDGFVSHGANILFFHNVASYSHRVSTWPLVQALAQRGHDVTVISPFYFREPDPNITEIVPRAVAKHMDHWFEAEFNVNSRVNQTMSPLISHVFAFGRDTCKLYLTSPEFQTWLNKTKSLDLVVVDNAVAECGISLAYKYKAKHIYFSTVISHSHEAEFLGSIPDSSAIPELENDPVTSPLSFYKRVRNTVTSMIWRYTHSSYMVEMDNLLRSQLDMPNMPNFYDLARNASLVFYTGDVVTDHVRSHPPMFVNIAGIHCKPGGRPLPVEIQTFLHGGKSGFVYISLGTVVYSSKLPENVKEVFFKTIESLPHINFLWKWNGDFPQNIPNNLFLAKWFPQTDILAHPNIRAFVTQSGRPSTIEAVYYGVPMIAFPVLGDQDNNANRVNEMGGNIKFELGTFTIEEFSEAITNMTEDPKWKHRMRTLQAILRDRPMSPLDTAVWWTEYVLRHPNTDHLKPAGFNQPWYQRRLLDVYAFLFISLLLFLAYLIFCSLFALKAIQSTAMIVLAWWIRSKNETSDKKLM